MKNKFYLISLLAILTLVPSVTAQKNTRTSDQKRTAGTASLFTRADAVSDGNGVLVRWETSHERSVLGYEVLRSGSKGWSRVGAGLIPGGYFKTGAYGASDRRYQVFDPDGDFGSGYIIRGVRADGETVSARVGFASFESDLYAQTGRSSAEMRKAALEAQPLTERYSPAGSGGNSLYSFGNLPPSFPQQQWVAARPGVKIGVKEKGIYRVTRTELENAGFDVNSDESLWQLYLNGNQQSIVVGNNGDYIEFYGQGVDTRSTDTNIYFLVVGDSAGARIPVINRKANGSNPALNYREGFYRRDRSFYVLSILNGDKENFFGQVITPGSASVQFSLDHVDHSVPKTYIQIGVQGFTSVFHKIAVAVNGVPLGSFSFTGATFKVADIGVPTQIINEGQNTVTMTGTASSSDFSLVEYVAAQYPRGYVARNDQLEFPVPSQKKVTVTGFSDGSIRVFDITTPDSPKVVGNAVVGSPANVGAAFQVEIPSNVAGSMFAVTDSALKTPASIVFNEPSTLSSGSNAWSMVIISHADWLAESETWATYRSGTGVTTVAVDVEDVYDEFGYGRRGAGAIREFINYARLNWAVPPGYALLVGDASYDPRNYTGAGGGDFVPTDMVETIRDESPSDESLADYDLDGLSEIAIGRVPAGNPTEVTNVLTKVMTFESTVANAPARGALCASDLPQIVNFEEICNRVIGQLPASVPKTSVNKSVPNPTTTLVNEMNGGKYVVNYSGHGSVVSWSNGGFFGTGNVASLTNQSDLSVYTMLTCLNGYFIDPAGRGLSETLFLATNGGAAATWSSTGETTPDIQEILATRFYNQLGNNPSLTRIGDLVKDAKTAVAASRDVRLSWHLLGDPAMKMK